MALANAQFEGGGAAAATPSLSRAEELIREGGEGTDLEWHLLNQRGLIRGRSGDHKGAAEDLDAVLPHLESFTPLEQCGVLLNRGNLWSEQGQPSVARDCFARAADVARRHGLSRQEFMARHNEGYAAYLSGDLPTALHIMGDADRVDADVSRGPALLDRARVLLEAGLLTEAAERLERAQRVCDTQQLGHVGAEVDLERAKCHLLLGDLDEAESHARSAVISFRAREVPALEARARLTLLEVSLLRGGEHEAVAASADEIAQQAVRRRDSGLAVFARALAAEALLGIDLPGARHQLTTMPDIEQMPLRRVLHIALVRASLEAAEGRRDEARAILRTSAAELARGQAESASLDLRTAQALHGVRLAHLDLDLAVRDGHRPVLTALERWRTATERLPSVRPPEDPESARLYEKLRVVRSRLSGRPGDEDTLAWRSEAQRLEQLLRARDWAHRHTHRRTGPHEVAPATTVVDEQEIERHLASLTGDRDLLTFFTHRGQLWGLAVVDQKVSMRPLVATGRITELGLRIRADVRAAMPHGQGALRAAIMASLAESMAKIDDYLITPLNVGGRGLVIVPERSIATVPWGLVPSLRGVPVTVSQSLTAYVKRLPPARATRPLEIHVNVGPDLEHAAEEAATVDGIWRRRGARTSRSHTREPLVGALASTDLVHVAAHGTHEQDSPLFSTLLMSDGHLFAHELQPRGITAEHVVLSACDVGSATVRPGEESLGMAATMLALGARCVVAAVAPVPEDLAVATMTRYHERLAAGAASDEALADAAAATDPLAGVFVSAGSMWRA